MLANAMEAIKELNMLKTRRKALSSVISQLEPSRERQELTSIMKGIDKDITKLEKLLEATPVEGWHKRNEK